MGNSKFVIEIPVKVIKYNIALKYKYVENIYNKCWIFSVFIIIKWWKFLLISLCVGQELTKKIYWLYQ